MTTKRYCTWDVYLRGRWIDTVCYTVDCDRDYVRTSLIGHDGYSPEISVRLRS